MIGVSSQLRSVIRYRFLHEKVEAVLRGAAALGGCNVNATLSSIEEIAPRSRRDLAEMELTLSPTKAAAQQPFF